MTERTALAGKNKLASTTLLSDQRGAFAFEMPFVWLFLAMSLLLPLADVAAAGFRFISAWGALRNFGQSIQYDPPPDVTNASGWTSSKLAKADPRFPIQNFQLVCGNSACSTTNTASPKYYSYTTTVTLSPMVLRSVLCTSSCSFTLPYSERFSIGCSMHNLLRCRRGSAAFVTVIALVPLIGVVALGGEAGSWYVTKQHAQNAADSAAMSGAL